MDKEGVKWSINRREIIAYKLLYFTVSDLHGSYQGGWNITRNTRINNWLSEILKNRLKRERCLFVKGNKKRINEYIICSSDEDDDNSYLLSLPSLTFPFSHDTIYI